MKRRTFFRRLFGGLGLAAAAPATAASPAVLIQESPVAGFQFHQGDDIWSALAVGQKLSLVREASNPHDSHAVAVYFSEHKLGYVPRAENSVVAQMLDSGQHLEASICTLRVDEDPWQRIRFSVHLV